MTSLIEPVEPAAPAPQLIPEYLAARGGYPDIEEEVTSHPDIYPDPDLAYRCLAISRWNNTRDRIHALAEEDATLTTGLEAECERAIRDLRGNIASLEAEMPNLRGRDYKKAREAVRRMKAVLEV